MTLYLVTWPGFDNYDQYDSFVCCALSETEAKRMHPCGWVWDDNASYWKDLNGLKTYAYMSQWGRPDTVEVKYLGEATSEFTVAEVLCASFNAG